jgi:hypothetical protein
MISSYTKFVTASWDAHMAKKFKLHIGIYCLLELPLKKRSVLYMFVQFVEPTATCYFLTRLCLLKKGTTALMSYLSHPQILIVDDSQIDLCITTEMLRSYY